MPLNEEFTASLALSTPSQDITGINIALCGIVIDVLGQVNNAELI